MPPVLLGPHIAFLPPGIIYLAGDASTTATYAPAWNGSALRRRITDAPSSNIVTSKPTLEFSVLVYVVNSIVKIVSPNIYTRGRADGGEHRSVAKDPMTRHISYVIAE